LSSVDIEPKAGVHRKLAPMCKELQDKVDVLLESIDSVMKATDMYK